jgi:hypothetical protein
LISDAAYGLAQVFFLASNQSASSVTQRSGAGTLARPAVPIFTPYHDKAVIGNARQRST